MKSDFKGLFIFQSWSIGIASVMLTVIFLIIPALAAANNPPAANPTATPDIGPVPATVQFAANATDPRIRIAALRRLAREHAAAAQPMTGSPTPLAPTGFCGSAMFTAADVISVGTSR